MKKVILLVAVVAVAAITYVKASSEQNEFSLMSLAGVESIAGGEVRCSGNY